MIVTAHQPNYLPGVSVMRKLQAADAVIWLDCVQYSKGGFTNRNRLPDGTWLTVPIVQENCIEKEIRHIEIADFDRWPAKHCRTIKQSYSKAEFFEKGEGLLSTLGNAWRLGDKLADLNWFCIQQLIAGLDVEVEQHWQHNLLAKGETISERIADMVGLLGASTYLSGPSGVRYLDPTVFKRRQIRLEFFEHEGPNPSAIDTLFRHGTL